MWFVALGSNSRLLECDVSKITGYHSMDLSHSKASSSYYQVTTILLVQGRENCKLVLLIGNFLFQT